jgi:hypothetical protein
MAFVGMVPLVQSSSNSAQGICTEHIEGREGFVEEQLWLYREGAGKTHFLAHPARLPGKAVSKPSSPTLSTNASARLADTSGQPMG